MDFFAAQDSARRRTSQLVVLFLLAVVLTVVAVNVAFQLVFAQLSEGQGAAAAVPVVTLATLGVIVGGSSFKTLQLREGGPAVGRLLGGRPVDPNSSDLDERRLLNVVEEMAIASGVPVPTVYLLDKEEGINAFAAGRTPGDTVIGVTSGCLRQLSRDELQGVIGHEFSHVLNGDMRLNLRLMGVLHGILVIGLLGEVLLRGARFSGGSKKGGNPILLFGLALFVVGYAGMFFGRLIQSAVSRQREFLADASAVQFTRNPTGLAGALRKVALPGQGSRLHSSKAEQAGHMLFGANHKSLLGLLATHPPIEERIRRLDATLAEGLAAAPEVTPAAPPSDVLPVAGLAAGLAPGSTGATPPPLPLSPPGAATPEHLSYSASLLARLPAPLTSAAREPYGARALVFGLLLDSRPEIRQHQLEALAKYAEPAVCQLTESLLPQLAELPVVARLPLLDLALPALRRLSLPQFQTFRTQIRLLARADQRISPFEFTLERIVQRHLAPHFGTPAAPAGTASLHGQAQPCAVLLSVLARHGQPQNPEPAFQSGAAQLPQLALRFQPPAAAKLDQLAAALDQLQHLAPLAKGQLLRAAAATASHDGHLNASEGELLRAIADTLDCPIPPLLPL